MCRWETNSLPLCVCVCIRVLERLWLAKLSAADKVPVFSHCCAVSRPPAWHTEPSDQFGLVGAYTDSSSPLWLVGLLCCQTLSKAEDTRGRKPAPIFGVENRTRLSERVSCENDSENRLRFSSPIRTCSISRLIFGSTYSASEMTYIVSSGALNSTHSLTRKHVIDRSSRDWLKFIVFVWLVCKQYRIGENRFRLRFLLFITIFNHINA